MSIRVLIVLALALVPVSVGAHAFGVSHETIVDGIHVDIGYSSAAPTVGESVIFDFNLPVGEEDEVYTDVWVRVDAEDGSVKLATAVYKAEFGGPRMSYVFPEPGVYTISVRYENESDALLKTEWQLTVLPAPSTGIPALLLHVLAVLGGIVLGAVGVVLVKRRRT